MAAADTKNTDFWMKCWDSDHPPFELEDRHIWLARDSNLDVLLRGRPNQKVFFPLCGNAVDMKWLGDLGHTIVGVDLGAKGLEGFFKKHNIPYTSEPSEKCKGTLFKSNDGKYRLYACDFFEYSSELDGQFDAMFDSAALVAIHMDLRRKYADLMMSLMKPDCIHLLEGVYFPEKPWDGPPYGLVEAQVREVYEPRCTVKVLERFDYTIPGDEGSEGESMDCTMFSITLNN